jgi:hypothetical protein
MFLSRNVITCFIILIFWPAHSISAGPEGPGEIARSYVKRTNKDIKDVSLFSREVYDFKLIRKHRIFKVSSADLIPFRAWYVVLNEANVPFIHSYRNLRAFNKMTAIESMELKTTKDFLDFASFFTATAVPGERYLHKNPVFDRKRLKKDYRNLSIKPRVNKWKKGYYRIIFFTRSATGKLSIWRVYVRANGYVAKAVKKEISLY